MERKVIITQGEHAVEEGEDVCIATILGSCVACCLWDPQMRIGGMNHMLLARAQGKGATGQLQGIYEMELLINGLLKRGARKSRLLAKVFGGASMISGLSDIGAKNGRFTLEYLKKEDIDCVGHSLGGTSARHLIFWPHSGLARQKLVNQSIETFEKPGPEAVTGNGVDLF